VNGSGKRILGPIPEHYRRLMDAKDRGDLGKLAETLDDARKRITYQEEKALQEQVIDLLRLYNIEANRSSMAKKKTDRVGWPDITFAYRGQACLFECKTPGEKLTPEQAELIPKLRAEPNGWRVWIIQSVREAVDALQELGAVR